MGLGMEEYSVFHFHEKLDRQTFAENIWICGHATFPELFEFVDRFIGQVLSVFCYSKNLYFVEVRCQFHFILLWLKNLNIVLSFNG